MKYRLLFMLAAALTVAGCKKSRVVPVPTVVAEAPAACEGPTLQALTWNVALGRGMNPLVDQRIPAVAEALSSARFDVLCLQEAWDDGARDAIVAGLGLPPAHVLLPQTVGVGEDPRDRCETAELDPIIACADESCVGLRGAEFKQCVREECKLSLAPLTFGEHRCLNCLIATASMDDRQEIRRICTTHGASRIQGGRTGLLLASRWPLRNPETLLVPASYANRAALIATVDVPGLPAPVDVACTHLAASEKGIPPMHSGATDWREEKLMEIDAVAARLDVRARGRQQLLLGDLNTGPPLVGHDDVWNAVVNAGFLPPHDGVSPPCTSCPENSFRFGKAGSFVDHALLRTPPSGGLRQCRGERLFDGTIGVIDDAGRPARTHLSDHFGYRATFVAR